MNTSSGKHSVPKQSKLDLHRFALKLSLGTLATKTNQSEIKINTTHASE